jgi:hypothetical protein
MPDDRMLVERLLEIGVQARRANSTGYAMPTDEADLANVSVARIANWLETLGGHQLVGDVQPCFTVLGAGFKYQVTDAAVNLCANRHEFERWLHSVCPAPPQFDMFISYAAGDAALADELRSDLEGNQFRCFMAEKDVQTATEWQDSIREALVGSKRMLVLLTPRSINRPWVLMEIGAAWALGKPLIPALAHVAPSELHDPIRRYQGRVVETTAQRQLLVRELASR